MLKPRHLVFVLLLLLTAQATLAGTGTKPAPPVNPDSLYIGKAGTGPQAFIPNGYTPLDTAQTDLNLDKRDDLILILRRYDEQDYNGDSSPARLLLLLILQPDSTWQLSAFSATAVMSHDLGGVSSTDPFTGIELEDSSFTLTHFGGIGSGQWQLFTTFKYNPTANNWLLYKIQEHVISFTTQTVINKTTGQEEPLYYHQQTTYTPQDFGYIPLQLYSYLMQLPDKN